MKRLIRAHIFTIQWCKQLMSQCAPRFNAPGFLQQSQCALYKITMKMSLKIPYTSSSNYPLSFPFMHTQTNWIFKFPFFFSSQKIHEAIAVSHFERTFYWVYSPFQKYKGNKRIHTISSGLDDLIALNLHLQCVLCVEYVLHYVRGRQTNKKKWQTVAYFHWSDFVYKIFSLLLKHKYIYSILYKFQTIFDIHFLCLFSFCLSLSFQYR